MTLSVKYDLADHTITGKIYREAMKMLHKILEAWERERAAKKHLNVKRAKKRKKAI